jgi:hypothetical protein
MVDARLPALLKIILLIFCRQENDFAMLVFRAEAATGFSIVSFLGSAEV